MSDRQQDSVGRDHDLDGHSPIELRRVRNRRELRVCGNHYGKCGRDGEQYRAVHEFNALHRRAGWRNVWCDGPDAAQDVKGSGEDNLWPLSGLGAQPGLGNTTGHTVGGTGTGSSQALTVYGRVASQTTPSAGSYSDSVVVTVTY
jgi:hypothetical protein